METIASAQGRSKAELLNQALHTQEQAFGSASPQALLAMVALADYYVEEEDYKNAEPLLVRIVSTNESMSGARSAGTAVALRRLAVNYDRMRRFGDAEPLHALSLAITTELFGSESIEVADVLGDYASNFEAGNKLADAERYFARAVETWDRVSPSDSLGAAKALMAFGLFHFRQESYNDAEALIDRALQMRVRLGATLLTANSRDILGEVYQRTNRFREAAALHASALMTYEQEYGKDSDAAADVRASLAECYRSIGNYDGAAELFRRNLEFRKGTDEADKFELLQAYEDLGRAYKDGGRYALAVGVLREGLAEAEKLVGHESLWRRPLDTGNVAMALLLEAYGEALIAHDRFADAESALERALSAARLLATEGIDAGETFVGNALASMADLYSATGRPRLALPLREQVLGVRTREVGPAHHNTASASLELATLYEDLGLNKEAEEFFVKGLAIHRGKRTGGEASALAALAEFYSETGRFSLGEPLMKEALALRTEVSGSNNYRTAILIGKLGSMNDGVGNYREAERLLRESLRIASEQLGADSLALAAMYNNLAINLDNIGAYDEAERLFERSNRIRLTHLGPQSSSYASGLYSLAGFYTSHGARAQAKVLFEQAQAVFELSFGESHPLVALCLRALAASDRIAGRFVEADRKLTRSLEIYSRTLGQDHSMYYSTIGNLANLRLSQGDIAGAEKMFLQSVNGLLVRGEGNSAVVGEIENLAIVYRRQGKLDEALAYANRSLDIRRRTLGPMHADTAGSYFEIALVEWARKRPGIALEAFLASSKAYEATDAALFAIGDERRKLDYAGTIDRRVSAYVSFALANPSNGDAVALAFEALARRKGRVLDAVSRRPESRAQMDPREAELVRAWRAASSAYSKLATVPVARDAEWQGRLQASMNAAREAEAAVYLNLPFMRQQLQEASLASIRSAIPESSTLVEWVRFAPVDPTASAKWPHGDQERYAAFVLSRRGVIRVIDIGDAALIERDISDFAAALRDPASRLVRRLGRDLYSRLIEPLGIDDGSDLILSTDGGLNLLSFAALTGRDDKYLIQRRGIFYVTSGRDLLRPIASKPDWSRMALLANPAYGSQQHPGASTTREAPFEQLSGSTEEATQIAAVLGLADTQVFTDLQASKSQVEALHRPSVLHIATHAFFAPRFSIGGVSASPASDNPLARAGLALAGANDFSNEDSSGIMTALEVSSLDLEGTELVVLSACDAGTGEASVGDGVFGLRRAFQIAGARAQVVTLWRVADSFPPVLMRHMYSAMAHGQSPGAALRSAQLAMLDGPFAAPYYWANFVAVGSVW